MSDETVLGTDRRIARLECEEMRLKDEAKVAREELKQHPVMVAFQKRMAFLTEERKAVRARIEDESRHAGQMTLPMEGGEQ